MPKFPAFRGSFTPKIPKMAMPKFKPPPARPKTPSIKSSPSKSSAASSRRTSTSSLYSGIGRDKSKPLPPITQSPKGRVAKPPTPRNPAGKYLREPTYDVPRPTESTYKVPPSGPPRPVSAPASTSRAPINPATGRPNPNINRPLPSVPGGAGESGYSSPYSTTPAGSESTYVNQPKQPSKLSKVGKFVKKNATKLGSTALDLGTSTAQLAAMSRFGGGSGTDININNANTMYGGAGGGGGGTDITPPPIQEDIIKEPLNVSKYATPGQSQPLGEGEEEESETAAAEEMYGGGISRALAKGIKRIDSQFNRQIDYLLNGRVTKKRSGNGRR